MSVLVVEVADFAAASEVLRHEVAENVQLCLSAIAERAVPELVGVDPAGTAWAASYDTAARSVVAASGQMVDAARRVAQMLAVSGRNYDHADTSSTTGGATPIVDWIPLLDDPPPLSMPVLPPAGGAGARTPAGWWLVAHTVGYLWPAGHQDRLRSTAAMWRSAARALDLAVPRQAVRLLAQNRTPELDAITRVCTRLDEQVRDLAAHYRALADSCEQYAGHLDECHDAIRDELTELLVESAALQAGGAALSVLTFGLAEVPTQAAQAARITAAATRIGGLIEHLTTAAHALGDTTRAITGLADNLAAALHTLAATPLVYAKAVQVPRLERLARTERRVERGVASEQAATKAASAGNLPAKLVGRKPGDPGVWGDERTLADHYTRHRNRVGANSIEDYARRASDFLQEGLQRRLPHKIDGNGTIRMWDPESGLFGSFRRDGSTRSFYRTKDPKYFDRQEGELQ